MDFLKNCLAWYKAQTKQRQMGLAISLVLLSVFSVTICFYYVFFTNYALLFNNLDSRDASQIIKHLEQANISYRLHNQGADILIDKNLVDKTRLQLMGSGMQLSGSVGFELFDKTDFGLTDFSQKINFQRALQGELERTISSLEEIKQARVHLVIPEQHLFQQENNQPRAAISLHLAHPLSPEQIKGIQQLVTASVAHMQKSNVVLVDQNGNNLTNSNEDLSSSHFVTKKNVEGYLSEKVLQMLNRVFSDEEFMVKIDVTLNYDELERELIKPQQDGIITHEKETQHSTSSKTEKAARNQDLTREKSYQFGSKKERFTRASGKIERLTLSVVVPQNTSKERLQQIERLVKSVVGFNADRGDSISIEALVTQPQLSIIPPVSLNPQPYAKDFIYLIGLALLGLLLFYVLKRKERQQKRQLLLTELTQWLHEHDY